VCGFFEQNVMGVYSFLYFFFRLYKYTFSIYPAPRTIDVNVPVFLRLMINASNSVDLQAV